MHFFARARGYVGPLPPTPRRLSHPCYTARAASCCARLVAGVARGAIQRHAPRAANMPSSAATRSASSVIGQAGEGALAGAKLRGVLEGASSRAGIGASTGP